MRTPKSFVLEFSNSSRLRKLFGAKSLAALARSVGFVKRQRDLTASAFLHICTFSTAYPTFEQMRGELMRFRIHMEEPSISERFTQSAVAFMKAVFHDVLKLEFGRRHMVDGLGSFVDVIVGDSSIFNLHAKCAADFTGSGGGAPVSSAKVQFSFGLLTAKVYEILLGSGVKGDAGHRFKDIVANALYLFDLGFFCAANFRAVIDGGAYFVSRYRYGVTILREDGREITMKALDRYVRMLKPGQTVDLRVRLFKEQEIPARLVLHKLPKAVGDEIRRKLRTDKQKKLKNLSVGRMAFCDVNAYITNLSGERMPAENLRSVYGLRWQVEIMFKTWKSGLDLDKVRNVRSEVFQCMLYGGFIRMLLCVRIFSKAKLVCWQERGVELSEIKGMKLLKKFIAKIREWLVTRKRKNGSILSEIWRELAKTCIKDAKKGDLTPFETMKYYA